MHKKLKQALALVAVSSTALTLGGCGSLVMPDQRSFQLSLVNTGTMEQKTDHRVKSSNHAATLIARSPYTDHARELLDDLVANTNDDVDPPHSRKGRK